MTPLTTPLSTALSAALPQAQIEADAFIAAGKALPMHRPQVVRQFQNAIACDALLKGGRGEVREERKVA